MTKRMSGHVYQTSGADGRFSYVYRRLVRLFEKDRKYMDVRHRLGGNLERALEKAKQLDAKWDPVERGEQVKPDLSLTQAIEWYIRRISVERMLLAWKEVSRNLATFLAFTGNRLLKRVTRDDIERFLEFRKRVVRPMTVNGNLRDIKRLMNTMVQAGYLEKTPTLGIRPLRAVPLPVRLPTPLEVERLRQASPVWLRRIILMLLSTGARLGEVNSLDWSDVDLTAGTVKLRRRKVGDELMMPLAKSLRDELWSMNLEAGGPTKGPVFTALEGRPVTVEHLARAFRVVTHRLGWPWFKLKTFRKLVATEVWRRTGDARVVQKTLGHSTLWTSEKFYIQAEDEARQRGVDAMEAYMGAEVANDVGNFVGNTPLTAPEAAGKKTV